MSLKFGPDVRLRSRREYLAVQEGGRRVSTRYLTMLGLPNTVAHDRLGIIASRRLGGAVVRNRAKRRLRELFRQSEPRVVAGRAAIDVVVIPRREFVDAPMPLVHADFQRGLGRLRSRQPA